MERNGLLLNHMGGQSTLNQLLSEQGQQILIDSEHSGDIETISNDLSGFPIFGDHQHNEIVDSILPKDLKDSFESEPKTKRSFNYDYDEKCPICNDKVSGYHYGILTCESCKGFFKRTVQNKKMYQCVDKGECTINKLQRKRCPACRYAKCILVGMKLEAVREDRLRGGRNKFGPLYKHDRALKQQKKAMIRNASIMQNMQPTNSFLPRSKPKETLTQNPPETSPPFTDPRIKIEKYPFQYNSFEQNPEMYHGSPHNFYSRNLSRSRSPYSEYFHPYLGAEEGRFPYPYGYPYPDSRYFRPFRPPFLPPRHHFMRYHDDERESFYKRMNMNDNYFTHHSSERYRTMHPGHSSQFEYPPSSPHPAPHPSPFPPRAAQAPFPAPNEANRPNEAYRPPLPPSPTFTSTPASPISAHENERFFPGPNRSPFECSNPELIKKMICSWVPEEDLRKQGQLPTKEIDNQTPLQIICKVVEQILYSMVDWAKSSIFFRDMTTEDQMSLLHETWSELVLLDHIYRQVWFSDSESILLVNGKSLPLNDLSSMFDVSGCKLIERVAELSNRFRQIQIDRTELVCLKFLILFNVKDSKAQNQQFMSRVSERINSCLLEYVHSTYPDQTDRFLQLLMRLPDVRGLSLNVENWLNDKYLNGFIQQNTLIAEMLNIRFQKTMG